MDWAIFAIGIGFAWLGGELYGFYLGRKDGLGEAAIRRRLGELPKPWEQR